MRVLIITNYFPPEIGGAAHLYFELSEWLVSKGHKVTIITGFPRYNFDRKGTKYSKKILLKEYINGIKIIRLPTISFPRHSKVARGLDHFIVSFIFFFGASISGPQDVILIYSPPLTLGLSAYVISKIKGIPFIVNIQDLFPKEAVALGLLKNKLIIRIFEKIEKYIYNKATYITVHSPGNKKYIMEKGVSKAKVKVLYNWVDTERIRPQKKENDFFKRNNLYGKFVASYAGTIGWCQDVNIIIEAAELIQNYEDIIFLIVGDGPDKEKIVNVAEAKKLKNVIFLPTQPWDIYPQILVASDISLINLNKNLSTPVVPSKLLNIMASGRPVVASLPLDGDSPKIIEKAQCGLYSEAEDSNSLTKSMLKLYKDESLRKKLGENGRKFAIKFFSKNVCIKNYESLFFQALNK